MESDENYGYRFITDMLDFDENGWVQVRRGMLGELNAFSHLCEDIYQRSERLKEIWHALNHFDGRVPYDKWMVMRDMGYLISSR